MSTRSYVRLKTRLLADASVAALAETFKVLGDATRVRILDALARAEVRLRPRRAARARRSRPSPTSCGCCAACGWCSRAATASTSTTPLDDQHIVSLFEQGLEHVQERDAATRDERA